MWTKASADGFQIETTFGQRGRSPKVNKGMSLAGENGSYGVAIFDVSGRRAAWAQILACRGPASARILDSVRPGRIEARRKSDAEADESRPGSGDCGAATPARPSLPPLFRVLRCTN